MWAWSTQYKNNEVRNTSLPPVFRYPKYYAEILLFHLIFALLIFCWLLYIIIVISSLFFSQLYLDEAEFFSQWFGVWPCGEGSCVGLCIDHHSFSHCPLVFRWIHSTAHYLHPFFFCFFFGGVCFPSPNQWSGLAKCTVTKKDKVYCFTRCVVRNPSF